MAKRSTINPNKHLASSVPQKEDAIELMEPTAIPGEETPFFLNEKISNGTTDENWEKATGNLSAPVKMPSRGDLTTFLVDRDLVYKLEEYREDQYEIMTFLSIFIGAGIGIIVNWVTTVPFQLTSSSVILLLIFVSVCIFFWFYYSKKKKLADKKIQEINDYRFR